MKHLLSFLRSPLGYMFNLVATLLSCLGRYEPLWLEDIVVRGCETFCIPDGIQDDWHPLVPLWLANILPK